MAPEAAPIPVATIATTMSFAARALVLLILVLVAAPVAAIRAAPGVAAVASAHPLATAAGHEILGAGGNAFDAAVAVAAVLAVVAPSGSGLGGGGFWLLHRAEDANQIMLDARERAPLAAHRDMYLDSAGHVVSRLSLDGPLAAAIPGVPKALEHLANHYGRLPLSRSLAPAIRHARTGFAVDEDYHHYVSFRVDSLRKSAAAAQVFLDSGAIPQVGHIIKQSDLARTLTTVAERGAAGFYTGPLAAKLVGGVRAAGGIWTLQDLQEYRVVEREPVYGAYNGTRVVSAAPPSSGGVAIVTMLNILAGYDLGGIERAVRSHLIIESMRRAYRDRAEFLGDPDRVQVPVQWLTSPAHAGMLRQTISATQATPSEMLEGVALPAAAGANTTHYSILDREGNRVAATLSINYPFGACFVPPGTGVLLNNEMDDFSAKPGTPNAYGLIGNEANAIAPGKRPLSSMSPTFLENDRGVAILGTPGGSRIITMVLLAALDYMDGGDANSMVTTPRFHHQYLPDVVEYEVDAFSEDEAAELSLMGHVLKPLGGSYGDKPRQGRYGNMQAITWDRERNTVDAASDPRGEGRAEVR